MDQCVKGLFAAALATAALVPATAMAQDAVKLGIVAFLSGPAAGPFGVPARNGAEVLSGLSGGARVAESPVDRLVDGDRVEIRK